MTRYLLLLLALCSVSFGQSLEGFWAGTLQVEGKTLRAWVEFTKAADGTLTAVAESPDESNEKFPVHYHPPEWTRRDDCDCIAQRRLGRQVQ